MEQFMWLHRRIRVLIYGASLLLSGGLLGYVTVMVPAGQQQITRLTQCYALTALAFLYLTLFISPATQCFSWFPKKGMLIYARRALGLSAFYFGLLHGSNAFFRQLGGFPGLGFLSGKYLLAVGFSSMALLILTLMAATSFDRVESALGHARWKMLHRFVYLAGLLILIHALMLGTHFADLSGSIPQTVFLAVSLLLVLEAIRFDRWLEQRQLIRWRVGISVVAVIVVLTIGVISMVVPAGSVGSLGIHALHIQQAKDAQKKQAAGGTGGDASKRYNVSISAPPVIEPGKDTAVRFSVYDAGSGNPVVLFQNLYEKFMHLIVVDNSLVFYAHVHPEQHGNAFDILLNFPYDGRYHLYVDFQPFGATEQQFAFTIDVGQTTKEMHAAKPADQNLTKQFESYEVTLSYPKPLLAKQLSTGQQEMAFTVKDAQTKKPVTTLQPYLAAYGHLVMIHEKTYEYIHVHPVGAVPAPGQNGGPDVKFLPLGLYGPIIPGTYRVFAQFNPEGKLMLADFTINVE